VNRWMRALGVVAALAAGATFSLSCSVNDYCLNCETGDGGHGSGDGGSGSDGGEKMDAMVDAGCIPSGAEQCDGKDNDCNGLVDDGVLPGVGDLCPNQMGECAGGVEQCINGAFKCTKSASPEICDGKDNNCNGTPDEGDPGGGGKCGTDLGECIAGQFHCNAQTGQVECFGFVDHTGDPELCDGKDNDCDGNFDENIGSLGGCGPTTNTGECNIGSLMCQGGAQVCIGAKFPAFELCNTLDDDCDGNVDEIFNKQTDVTNCGTCGNVCQPTSKTCVNSSVATVNKPCTMDSDCPGGSCAVNSQPKCQTGGCTFQCNAGFQNLNGTASDGCEYHCFATGAEECDGIDNDCNGIVDDGVVAPPICLSGGECGVVAPTAQCTGAGGWTCTYTGDVQFPETKCDGKNNDCDANTDESQPNLGQACDNGQQGVCKTSGTYICDANNLNGPAVCNAPAGPAPGSLTEDCDDKDNDCDGLVDEGGATGSLPSQMWVDIGGNKQMMKYEASKPDATSTDPGARTNRFACSKPGVLPWRNITYPQAAAACAAIGASLCDESTWHRACSAITTGNAYPLAVNGTGTLIEAEDYSSIGYATGGSPSATRSWVPDYTAGFSSVSAMEATPNTGAAVTLANAAAQSPHIDYLINFTATGTYHVWLKMYSNNGNDNQAFVGINALAPPQAPSNTATTTSNGSWQWVDTNATFSIPTTGPRYVSVFMGKDGTKVDQLYIINGAGSPPSTINSKGNKWAYATSANTYNANTCNGDDYDTNTNLAGDQDDILATGSLASCYANLAATSGNVFDMSGNAKEWTKAHAPGENPIRGGASNNTADGISCPLNFTLADDAFYFPNIGFRCCRPKPP